MKLQIDIKKIIKLLAKDIYDSPFALLRENLQNAYDAVLMRRAKDESYTNPEIRLTVSQSTVTITDNGIGMTQDVIENNFWKAGASGKNNEEARRAGVVGTFGIGAMANFGVCKKLEVHSCYYSSNETIITSLDCDEISLDEDCITRDSLVGDTLPKGTTVIASLNPGVIITEEEASSYLTPYVQYLPIPVYLNDHLLSQKDYVKDIIINDSNSTIIKDSFHGEDFGYDIELKALNHTNGLISLHITNITSHGVKIHGDMVLRENGGTIFGLRNGFGLAPIALGSSFKWGGVANLSDLTPTAGRDSLTRESIGFISSIVLSVEQNMVKMYSKLDACDLNRDFLLYIYQHKSEITSLAPNIKIRREPGNESIKLKDVHPQIDGRTVRYYSGSDESIINMFANEENYLLVLSNDRVRSYIQGHYLDYLNIETIPDKVTATDYKQEELDSTELSILFRIEFILQNDYLINNVKVYFSEITHNQPVMVEFKDDKVKVHLKKGSHSINYLRQVYQTDYSLFDGFVKDYVRQILYPHLSNYVPSATKQGADALMRIMKQKKDLFSIEEKEMGQIDEVISDYLRGKATLADVHRASSNIYNSQKQVVSTEQTGSVEDVVPSVRAGQGLEPNNVNSIKNQNTFEEALLPQPPILRLDYETSMKLLKAEVQYPALNNNLLFLALSDKLFDRYSDFFLEPHSTKVIWSTHKIVYVFTHISSQVSMYYDIDLKQPLPNNMTGGHPIKSTTIITKNKIFVPIPSEMHDYFNLDAHNGRLEFFVRFDTMSTT